MRFRKKLIKGVSLSVGKRKSSITVAGVNIPLNNGKGKPSNTQDENTSKGCFSAIIVTVGIIVLVSVISHFTKTSTPVQSNIDSFLVNQRKDSIEKPLKKHKKHRKKKKDIK